MQEFYTTRFVNELVRKKYYTFIDTYYSDILKNPNVYISITEKAIADYLGGGYARLLNSGTTALQFALLASGVGPGDEVILPSNTYIADAIAVTNIGAKPVFCDIQLGNFCLDVQDVEKKITQRTRAIIPVHLYGYPADIQGLKEVVTGKDIKIIEDASHSFGGEILGKKIGTLGDIGVFSAHVSKNFGTLGNGGIFFTKEKAVFEKLENYIYPDNPSLEVLTSGRTPANIGAFDSIFLLIKLKFLSRIMEDNTRLYIEVEKKYKKHNFQFPDINFTDNRLHIRNFTVLCDNRDQYISSGLGKNFYGINLRERPIFSDENTSQDFILDNTDIFFKNNLSLNFYYGMKLL